MNYVATTLGICLPTLKARDAVMNGRNRGRLCRERITTKNSLRDQPLLLRLDLTMVSSKMQFLTVDDDTVSTTLSSDDTSVSSCCCAGGGRTGSIRFAEPLVTKVYYRPSTTPAEKRILYYSDMEYREFRKRIPSIP